MRPRVYDARTGDVTACSGHDATAPRHLLRGARGAARDASAGSSRRKCARTSTSGRRRATSPTRSSAGAASSGSSGSTTPRRGVAATAISRPASCSSRSSRGAGAAAIAMAISVQSDMATPALAQFGSDAQRERWLRPAIAGEKIGAIAITEPDAGSDVAAIRTRAVRDGDVWRVNGTKMFITNGTRAHFLTLVARTRPSAGVRVIAASACSSSTPSLPGVSISRKLDKLGMWSSDTAEIALDDVAVPADELIGGRTEPRLRAADVAAPVRTARGRGGVRRPRRADARGDDRVRARPHDVRPPPHRAPGHRAQARRRRDRARSRAARCSTRPRGA